MPNLALSYLIPSVVKALLYFDLKLIKPCGEVVSLHTDIGIQTQKKGLEREREKRVRLIQN